MRYRKKTEGIQLSGVRKKFYHNYYTAQKPLDVDSDERTEKGKERDFDFMNYNSFIVPWQMENDLH
jgi:hypothetical protein